MDKATKLRQLVAPLAGVNETDLSRNSQLAGRLKNSIGRATLDSLLRREFGIRGASVYRATTFGELEDAVLGNVSIDPPRGELVLSGESKFPPDTAQACGVDIERVDELPEVADFWEAEFYCSHFTRDEIAYCCRQESPREHFAARWCAKESLRKCDSHYTNCAFDQIEVVVEVGGRIRLAICQKADRILLPHTVSIAHTADSAIAVVFRMPGRVDPAPAALAEMAREDASKSLLLPTVLALLSLALSLWSILR